MWYGTGYLPCPTFLNQEHVIKPEGANHCIPSGKVWRTSSSFHLYTIPVLRWVWLLEIPVGLPSSRRSPGHDAHTIVFTEGAGLFQGPYDGSNGGIITLDTSLNEVDIADTLFTLYYMLWHLLVQSLNNAI